MIIDRQVREPVKSFWQRRRWLGAPQAKADNPLLKTELATDLSGMKFLLTEKELDWNSASLMERMQGNCAGRSENQTWDWSSESDTDAFDLDSNVSEEELNEEYDYLRSLLQIVGKPPPFRYYTEFENAMNSPRIGSSFPFLHAGVCSKKDREEGRESPSRGDDGLSLDQGISATVNSADEGESSSLGGVSQNKKARYSGVVAPFAMRTLSHPSFQSFYTAVSYRQRQSPITEIGSSTFKNKDSVDSCSSADSKAKYEATGFHSQAIDMPALHQCEFFYTDPMLPSGYRVYNHLSLPTRQMWILLTRPSLIGMRVEASCQLKTLQS
ncbi:uncharacterized protein [Mobula birostris]|uniref:uncharacterized protein isoform X3 n=1 Tax=Mobula birostris TaxID=1983395 RepID=UPI003B285ADC